uniref:Transposase Tc1-like domain-containing protein n=1 Tax=Lates calcarifer TaxID=8187 RepID=A0A4W6EPE3_LATCA
MGASKGYSYCQIARKCRCSPSAVGYTLQKYRRTNSLEDKPRSGRPRVSSAGNDRILICMCRCSTRTVRGQLLDRGLRSYKVVKKPLINERQRLAQCCWGPSTQELDSQELEEDSWVR